MYGDGSVVACYRYAIPEDDLDTSLQAYQWPKKMIEIMKESTAKITAEQRQFEQELKTRRKDFGHLVEEYEKGVSSLQDRNEIQKKDQIMLQVRVLMKRNSCCFELISTMLQYKAITRCIYRSQSSWTS